MKKMASLLLVLFAIGLGGCNTMSGVGKDIEKGGEAVQKAANK
ncbi:MAG: entericidin A/B family lipoprotein [Sulfuricellaceae bacterium]|nr:entericidin A/B family lipoprotein [Sulfuricellaceae bacterium]